MKDSTLDMPMREALAKGYVVRCSQCGKLHEDVTWTRCVDCIVADERLENSLRNRGVVQ